MMHRSARMIPQIGLWIAALLAPAVQAAEPAPAARDHALDASCMAKDGLRPICGVPFPEDVEPVPGTTSVIASDMHLHMGPAGIEQQPGVLKRVDLRTAKVSPLYPAPLMLPGRPDWGDPACPGEIGAKLLPHGINLSRRTDGAWQLLVVNHGSRESVEVFELVRVRHDWALRWRGCAVAPASSHLNDVAALPGGGFLVTTMHMGRNDETRAAAVKAANGENTGFLWRWEPGKAFVRQPGSDAPMPNGVQTDAFGRFAYINTASRGGDVRKLDLASGQIVGSVVVPNPDNASWTRDGRLLVAGVAAGPKPMVCFNKPEAPCPFASEVYAINVAVMPARRLFAYKGAPVNAATVAVQFGNSLLIGSAFGDSIVEVPRQFGPGK